MKKYSRFMDTFQIFAGWWRHQPGALAVGSVPTAHKQHSKAKIRNTPYFIALFIAMCIFVNSSYSQNKKNKNYIPEKGFWVLENNINEKKNTVVRFYDENSNLIYEERITGISMNIKRKRILKKLNACLEKALIVWNQEKVTMRNKDWVFAQIKQY